MGIVVASEAERLETCKFCSIKELFLCIFFLVPIVGNSLQHIEVRHGVKTCGQCRTVEIFEPALTDLLHLCMTD